ncbi:MAG: peptidoglycan DD-metalloendopeptidase family protein [Litorimonas sp.]
MVVDVFGDMRKRVLQTFPERQIYLRSGGEVTYYNLTTRVQLAVVTVVAGMALWCLLTLLNMAFGGSPFMKTDARIAELEAAMERQLAESQAQIESTELLLQEQRASFTAMAADIEAKHDTLSELVGGDSILSLGEEPLLRFVDTEVLMAPTLRDRSERVARRTSLNGDPMPTGLSIDSALTALDETQDEFLLAAEAELLDTIQFKRSLVQATDMNLDEIMAAGAQGQGGPFIPLDGPTDPLLEGQFLPRMETIKARYYEAEALQGVVDAMPIAHPVLNETVMTSRFGVRRDPFTKRPTHHNGLDFIGGPMAPIVATAPGKVVKAGWNGAFGNMVEIDHGYGFVTRYAHLKKLHVKRGQVVELGDKVGGMGSTGRSTATHLHYEVRFNGRAYDPLNFIKAGLHVH